MGFLLQMKINMGPRYVVKWVIWALAMSYVVQWVTLFVIEYHVHNPSAWGKKSLWESRDKARIFACTPDESKPELTAATRTRTHKLIKLSETFSFLRTSRNSD